MTVKTKFKNHIEFRTELAKVVEELWDNYHDATEIMTQNLVAVEASGYHFVSQLLKPPYKSRTKATFCSLLYKNVYNAELISAGAGEVTFATTVSFVRNYLQKDLELPDNEAELTAKLNVGLEKLRLALKSASGSVSEKDLWLTIANICGPSEKNLAAACWEAVKLAGLEGRVFVEDGKQQNYVVELKEGYTFDLKPYKFFLDNKGKWEARQCKVLVVDGFVEAVSEIDQLLNEAHDKKQPMALIAHGFSEEVVSTLYTNFQKKLLNVVPLRLMSDIDSLNVINDIGVVCGKDPVSSLKGELLTFVKYEELPIVERMIVNVQNTSIENFKSRSAVFGQVKALLDKREENRLVGDIQNILDGRIRSLSPNAVMLYLPEMTALENDAQRIKLDVALRQVKTLLNYGIVSDHAVGNVLNADEIVGRPGGQSTMVSNSFEEDFFLNIEDVLYSVKGMSFKSYFPTLCFYAGSLIGSRLAYMILASKGAIQVDAS